MDALSGGIAVELARPPRGELVVVNAPTLAEGIPELLHAAWAEYWLAQPDTQRVMVEALHQLTGADVVVTPNVAVWL